MAYRLIECEGNKGEQQRERRKRKYIKVSTNKSYEKSHNSTLSYTLFLYLSELKIRKKCYTHCLKLIKWKLLVTDTLISQTKNRCRFSDVEVFKPEYIISNRLKLPMLRILSEKKSGPTQKKEKETILRRRDDDDEVSNAKRRILSNNSVEAGRALVHGELHIFDSLY